ncbi:hypothetical protein BLOT_011998 [Blomia tropicalis]|nr:hypothetical protein BLOT_011998 [Blomia tropicalis]
MIDMNSIAMMQCENVKHCLDVIVRKMANMFKYETNSSKKDKHKSKSSDHHLTLPTENDEKN